MQKKIKLRSLLIGGIFTLFFIGLLVRLYWVQVVQASWLLEQAERRWEADKTIAPVRGMILDRNGKVLAEDAPAYTISVNPKIINAYRIEEDVVKGLTDILKTSDDASEAAALQEKIRRLATMKKDDGTFYDQREIRPEGWKIDKEKADKIKELIASLQQKLNIKSSVGITMIEEKKRYYPGGTLAAQLLGYSDKEGKPAMGLEAQLDETLRGIPGKINYEKDAAGVELPDAKVTVKPAVDGKNVRLTIDKNIQFYMENALEKVVEKFNPKSIMAIAADPKTMEILGMYSYPNFDPNQYWTAKSPSDFMNRAVAAQFEPGSTFKLVTLAATVKEGLFHPNDTYQSGTISVPGRTLHDHNDVGWGRITYLEGLKRSSNVAFVKLGYEMLGQDKLKDYISAFGFGQKTGIDVPGEVAGSIPMKYPAEFATATYGQGLTVTAIQEAAAYGAIANGGKLMWPHVVKDILDPKTGEVVRHVEPKVVRQVVPEDTAKQVSEYLEQVVSDQDIGTGRNAYIDGYRIAGKTGTANFVPEGGKEYAKDKWIISFAGYAPVEDPKILVTIIVDQPDLGGDYHRGSEVGPPAFREIIAQTLKYMGIPSSKQQKQPLAAKENTVSVPDLTGRTLDAAKEAAGKFGLKVEALGKGDKVLKQFPPEGTQIVASQRIYVAMQDGGDLPVPDLTGRSLRDAIEVCSFVGVSCQTAGEGYVVGQSVDGSGSDRVVSLQLRPPGDAGDPVQSSGDQNGDKEAKQPDSSKTDKKSKTNSTGASGSSNAQGSASSSGSSGSSKKVADPAR